MPGPNDFYEYHAITEFYRGRVAERSQVPLMNHIDEGLFILRLRNNDPVNTPLLESAWCAHPLFQNSGDTLANMHLIPNMWPMVVALVFEYRNIANASLSAKTMHSIHDIDLSPLPLVNELLVADKVQNRKDFETYHKGTHPNSKRLDRYFRFWLERLDVSEHTYQELCIAIDRDKAGKALKEELAAR